MESAATLKAYSPDGRFLVATTLDTNALILYALPGIGEELEVLCRGEVCCRRSPVFSPDGGMLATVCGQRLCVNFLPQIQRQGVEF